MSGFSGPGKKRADPGLERLLSNISFIRSEKRGCKMQQLPNLYDLAMGKGNRKRTLSDRDRQLLWRGAGKKCANPYCHKRLEYDEMEMGHKNKAFSKGGATTLRNAVCLCHDCNKKQGTDSWDTFLKKQAIVRGQAKTIKELKETRPKEPKEKIERAERPKKKRKSSSSGWRIATPSEMTRNINRVLGV